MTLTLQATRTVTVTMAEDALSFNDVMRVEQKDGFLRLYDAQDALVAEFAPPPAGWRAWRWMPVRRQSVDESRKPGQVLADLGDGYLPIPAHSAEANR